MTAVDEAQNRAREIQNDPSLWAAVVFRAPTDHRLPLHWSLPEQFDQHCVEYVGRFLGSIEMSGVGSPAPREPFFPQLYTALDAVAYRGWPNTPFGLAGGSRVRVVVDEILTMINGRRGTTPTNEMTKTLLARYCVAITMELAVPTRPESILTRWEASKRNGEYRNDAHDWYQRGLELAFDRVIF